MVSALASRIRDREIESRDKHFPQNQIIIFFYFLAFSFYFSHFWSKTMRDYILKVRQYWICNGKEVKLFYFSKWLIPHIRANKAHYVVIKLSIQGTMLLSRWKWPCTWWQILHKRKKERFVVLATFWKNDNSSCFWYTNSFNWKSSFILIYYKSEDGYPNFLFSYLLLIALYTYSTYTRNSHESMENQPT